MALPFDLNEAPVDLDEAIFLALPFDNHDGMIADMVEYGLLHSYGMDIEINHKDDTSASEYRNGKDMQGIPWERLPYSRKQYRDSKLKQSPNYANLHREQNNLGKEFKQVKGKSSFYDFAYNSRMVRSTIVHFQLRNLLWATSDHDVYMMQNFSVKHWSSLLRRDKVVLNVAGRTAPLQKHEGSQPLFRVRISTMVVKGNLIVAGGLRGELLCKYLDRPGVAFSTRLTNEENEITNAVDIFWSSSGSTNLMAANNDGCLRIFDTEKFALVNCFPFHWAINSASASPDGKLFSVLGDSTDCLVADSQSGKVIATLKGHSDFSFASAWHPEGQILATGNQDKTCRIWDVRKLSESLAVLKGHVGAIRSIKFSSDGQFLAMAESADFVHIYNTKDDYCSAQEIDLFGEIAGISFSPNTEAFFISLAGSNYGSLMEFSRRQQLHYLNSLI